RLARASCPRRCGGVSMSEPHRQFAQTTGGATSATPTASEDFWNLAQCLIWIGSRDQASVNTAKGTFTGIRLKTPRPRILEAQRQFGFDLPNCITLLWDALTAGKLIAGGHAGVSFVGRGGGGG